MEKKILGLDLGTNSIGWAVVNASFVMEDNKLKLENYTGIDDCGVRIFPEGVEPKTIGQGIKERSRNVTRREKRQMRRQFYRKRLRRIKLLELLVEQGMCPLDMELLKQWKNWDRKKKSDGRVFPETPEFSSWLHLNPYELRARALTEPLTLLQLGRVFYHLIHRRGFLTSRKGKGNEDGTIFTKGKPDENILPVEETRKMVGDGTLGKALYDIMVKPNEPFSINRNSDGREIRVRGRYTVRDMYILEFERIWMAQAKFFPELNQRRVWVERTRQLKGNLGNKRNQKRLALLEQKFGTDALTIDEGKQGIHKVTTRQQLDLKYYLAGDITIKSEADATSVQFKSNESVLFWQRPLRSQKSLLANCRFENELPVISANNQCLVKNGKIQTRSKKPCPLSHPEFERFRALQFVNNIKYGKDNRLTPEQREKVMTLINKNDASFTFDKIVKELKLNYEKFNYENDFKIIGNYTHKKVMGLFKPEIWADKSETIWHYFYFYDDNTKLAQKLTEKGYGQFTEADVKNIRLKDGYGNVSLKAIRNIMPYLEKGYTYDRAVILGGVRNAFGRRWEYFETVQHQLEREICSLLNGKHKEGEVIELIKAHLIAHDYGFEVNDPHFAHLYHHSQDVEQAEELSDFVPPVENLRNPIVQQGVNETRRLVNSLLKRYRKTDPDFQFARIHIEMGRELRNNRTQRQQMGQSIRDNAEKNDEARERLAGFGLKPSRENIQKYLLAKEIESRAGRLVCPYTGRALGMNDVLGGRNLIQIEHIIPYSISLDDNFGNKTLCDAKFNQMKGEKTPYQFFCENQDPHLWGIRKYHNPMDGWEEISERAFRVLPFPKAKRFTSKTDFESAGFIERQLNDTRYIARKTMEIMGHVCSDVRVMPGQLTAELRRLWGLNNVLQETQKVDFFGLSIQPGKAIPCYLFTDSDGNTISIVPKQADYPETADHELVMGGKVAKGIFELKQAGFSMPAPEMPDGRYWVRLKVNSDISLLPVAAEQPLPDAKHISFRGRVEKGLFNNENTGKVKTQEVDGTYFARFGILKASFIAPERKNEPKAGKGQVLLYGTVNNGAFKCYIYACPCNMPDGKYWILLDLDMANVEFIRAFNERPNAGENQMVIYASVTDGGLLSVEDDPRYVVPMQADPGRYYATLAIEPSSAELFPMDRAIPQLEKGQQLTEGTVWVDEHTGEIRFDPKKNRDDHRHHAIDAITIAVTEQRFLQYMSTRNAQLKDKMRGRLSSTEKLPVPWMGFEDDVAKAANGILVSHKQNNKTLTKNRRGFSVRGQLHKESVFGRRKAPFAQENGYHIRAKITELENNKHVAKVVDVTIRKLIEDHLRYQCGVDVANAKGYKIPKDAFFKNGEWQLFLPNKNGAPVPIKKVRISENIGNAMPLKDNINQYVNPRNNHHVLVYIDANGELKEEVVMFWTVAERRLQGLPIYQLPAGGQSIVATMEINDMFLIGLSPEDIRANWGNKALLSRHLYRVQKLSQMDYTFRHHLASTLNDDDQGCRIASMKLWKEKNPIKVKLDETGQLTLVTQ